MVYKGKISEGFWRRQGSGRALKDKEDGEGKLMSLLFSSR